MSVLRVAGWVEVRHGRMLAVRARGGDRFLLPGGKPEPGEALADTVVREVHEETGLHLERAGLRELGVVEAQAYGYPAGTQVLLHCFAGPARGEPSPRQEVEEVAWLDGGDRGRMAPGCLAAFEAFGPHADASRASMGT